MTVNEKYDFMIKYLNEGLAPHLQKYSGGTIKGTWDRLTSKMLSKWEAGASGKISDRVRNKARERIDQALRDPNYRKVMAKKYGINAGVQVKPVHSPPTTKQSTSDWPIRPQYN